MSADRGCGMRAEVWLHFVPFFEKKMLWFGDVRGIYEHLVILLQ